MASNSQNIVKDDIISSDFDQKSAIKNDILSVYDRFEIDISGDSIKNALASFDFNCIKKPGLDDVAEFIQEGLRKKLIEKIYNKCWDELEINNCLAILSQLKQAFNSQSKKVWRPTGKLVHEQLASLRLQIMSIQHGALEKKIGQEQVPELKCLFTAIEEKREKLKQHIHIKSSLEQIFNQKNDQMNKTFCRLTELQKELNYRQLEKGG